MRLSIFICITLLSKLSVGQNINFAWVKQFEGNVVAAGTSLTVDAAGNVYSTGSFTGTRDFDPGPGVYNLTQPSGNGIYISKLDANGNFVWARQFVTWNAKSYAIALDASGNVYTTGFYQQIADFDPGPGVFNLNTFSTGSDVFISKLDNNGNFVWAKRLGGPGNFYAEGHALTVDASSNICITGIFNGTIDLDPGASTLNITAIGNDDMFITKLDVSGSLVWSKQIGGVFYESAQGIAADNTGNLFITGYFANSVDFDPGTAVYTLTSLGNPDNFVLKLDPSGNFGWVKQIGGIYGETSYSIALDAAGNIYTTGYFRGTGDFDPGATNYNMTANGDADVFLCKLNSSGNFVWAKSFGGSDYDNGLSVTTDPLGNVYLTGVFNSTVDFDPGAATVTYSSLGTTDIFISKFISSGQLEWAKHLGSVDQDGSSSIGVTPSGDVYTTGQFFNVIDFDPGPGVYNVAPAGNWSAYVHKMSKCTNITYDTLNVSACSNFTFNNQIYTSSGTYTHVFRNSLDCDSIVTLNLTISGSNDTTGIISCNNYLWNGQLYTTSGFYRDTLMNANGCDSIINLNLTINNSVATTINATICEGQNYAGYNTTGTYVNSFPGVNGCDSTRTLNLIVKAKAYSTINTAICQGQVYLGYSSTGIFKDTLIAANGCDSIRTINLVVNPTKVTNINASICEGETYYVAGADQILPGTYRDILQTYLGCDSIIITHLVVHPKPLPKLGVDRGLCAGETITFNPGVFNNYEWQNQSTLPNFTTGTTGLYWVIVTDNNGCRGSDSAEIKNIFPNPANFLRQADSICQYEKLTIETFNSYKTYSWSTGSTSYKTVIDKPGVYTLNVTDKNDCKGKDTIQIIQKSCLTGVKIPTGFTPNGDQLNDVFRAKVYGISESFLLQVYDRWGNLVFSSSDPQKGWDGKVKGISVGTSVFVWQCSYKLQGEKPGFQKGTVTLIK